MEAEYKIEKDGRYYVWRNDHPIAIFWTLGGAKRFIKKRRKAHIWYDENGKVTEGRLNAL